jgi:hypothetical protein
MFPPVAAYALLGDAWWLTLLASALLTFFVGSRLPRQPSSRYRSVGDLARGAAGLNISALAGSTGTMRKRDVWPALETIIREELAWEGPLEAETRFFPATR